MHAPEFPSVPVDPRLSTWRSALPPATKATREAHCPFRASRGQRRLAHRPLPAGERSMLARHCACTGRGHYEVNGQVVRLDQSGEVQLAH